MKEVREVSVVFLGLGNVGGALLQQVLDTRAVQAERLNLRLVPIAVADVSGLLFDPDGLPESTLREALRVTREGRLLDALPQVQPLERNGEALRPGAILVDVTASTQTEPIVRRALEQGCAVVLANKHAMAGPWTEAESLYRHPRLRYEVTVGAGLPAIAGLHYLLDTGDRCTRIEGCLSGTLGYLCAELERGVAYSEAVARARALGYTEPDPREDLGGRDVARKALILARTAGWPLEMVDLTVEPLYAESLADLPTDEFMQAAATMDERYARRVAAAREQGKVLRYVARVDADGGEVGLVAVPEDGALGALRGPANYIALHTERYDEVPMVFSGPGAGPQVTAAGVLGDLIQLARAG